MSYLLLYKYRLKVLGPIEDEEKLKQAENLFRSLNYTVTRIFSLPAQSTLSEWKLNNSGQTTDGCWTKGLCSCIHGHRAWLAIAKDAT